MSTVCATASADRGGDGDGLYRRWDGDLTLMHGAGAGLRLGGRRETPREGVAENAASTDNGVRQHPRPTATIEMQALLLGAAGPFVAIDLGPQAPDIASFGVHLRPLFPALFLTQRSTGLPFVDLLIESIHVELGASLTPWTNDAGVGLSVGTGLDVPVVWTRRVGLALRLGGRFHRFRAGDATGTPFSSRTWTLRATLVLSHRVNTGLARASTSSVSAVAGRK